jgi:aquaporin Z
MESAAIDVGIALVFAEHRSSAESKAMPLSRRFGAEFIGTFWLVIGGCGSAALAAAFPGLGIGFARVALAFGLTVLTMVYAIGHVSGHHLNPAVSFDLWVGGRIPARDLFPCIIAQVLGAVAAAAVW